MIELDGVPELVDPVMIAAFEGWNDAGDAATEAVEHLEDVWDADEVGELDPEEFYDFQVNRPQIAIVEDGAREVVWPSTRVVHREAPLRSGRRAGAWHRAEHAVAVRTATSSSSSRPTSASRWS